MDQRNNSIQICLGEQTNLIEVIYRNVGEKLHAGEQVTYGQLHD